MMEIVLYLTCDIEDEIIITSRVGRCLSETRRRRKEVQIEQRWPLRIDLLDMDVVVVYG